MNITISLPPKCCLSEMGGDRDTQMSNRPPYYPPPDPPGFPPPPGQRGYPVPQYPPPMFLPPPFPIPQGIQLPSGMTPYEFQRYMQCMQPVQYQRFQPIYTHPEPPPPPAPPPRFEITGIPVPRNVAPPESPSPHHGRAPQPLRKPRTPKKVHISPIDVFA
jgi:hypothetical protein